MVDVPDEYLDRFTPAGYGRMPSRVLGTPGAAPVVVTHLLDLPGLARSADPPLWLDGREHADAVVRWLRANDLPPVILAAKREPA